MRSDGKPLRHRATLMPVAATIGFAALLLLGGGCDKKSTRPAPADPWTCSGTVLHRTDLAPLAGVSVWWRGARLAITDTAGVYEATLNAGRSAGDTLWFRKTDYSDAIGLLDSARVTGDRRLTLDVTMLTRKEDD